jgi:hypothetical protein
MPRKITRETLREGPQCSRCDKNRIGVLLGTTDDPRTRCSLPVDPREWAAQQRKAVLGVACVCGNAASSVFVGRHAKNPDGGYADATT